MRGWLLAGMLFLTSLSLSGLPLGNPAAPALYTTGLFCSDDPCCPSMWNVRVGFYGDYVFNRHLELTRAGGGNFEGAELYTNAGLITLNLFNRLDLFTTLGVTKSLYNANIDSFGGASGGRIQVESDPAFSYSLGLTGLIWQCDRLYVGGEAQYFHFSPDIKRTTLLGFMSEYEPGSIKYKEWQLGLGASYRIGYLVPYVGIKWARARQRLPADANTDLKSAKCWGYAIGVTLTDCGMAALTVEARFADEKALNLNAQLRF
ncbi:MAG: Major outer membrane porin [Chlamydiales bacterium]|nr:Major outer membrane porin [Chlamydiales bacterium]